MNGCELQGYKKKSKKLFFLLTLLKEINSNIKPISFPSMIKIHLVSDVNERFSSRKGEKKQENEKVFVFMQSWDLIPHF